MLTCFPIDLIVEIPWPDANASDGAPEPYLPTGGGALGRTLFPSGASTGPVSLLDLAVRLLRPSVGLSPGPMWVGTRTEAEHRATEQLLWPSVIRWPSVLGILLAARYLAHRRGGKRTTPRDVILALVLACPQSFALVLQARDNVAAAAFERHRRRAVQATDSADHDHVLLLAVYGACIHPPALSTLIPQLLLLFGPSIVQRNHIITDANAMAVHLLQPEMPGSLAENALEDPTRVCPVDDALAGVQIEHVRTFVRRIFRRTLRNTDCVDAYVDHVLSTAHIEAPPVDLFLEDDRRPNVARRVTPSARVHERLERGTTALTHLLPHQPHLVHVLAGKAALLGTELPPAPMLLAGGTPLERECLLRTLAEATDVAFVTMDGSQLLSQPSPATLYSWPRTVTLPMAQPPAIGTIVLVDGCDDLFARDELDHDWHRVQRSAAQRALAELLATGIPVAPILSEWPRTPILFVCGADNPIPIHEWHARRGMVPALREQLHDQEQLAAEPSVALMVEVLRTLLRRSATGTPTDATGATLAGFDVPDVTLATAARLAQRRRTPVSGARRVIEAAARRALLRQIHPEDGGRRIIAPDDLSAADLAD